MLFELELVLCFRTNDQSITLAAILTMANSDKFKVGQLSNGVTFFIIGNKDEAGFWFDFSEAEEDVDVDEVEVAEFGPDVDGEGTDVEGSSFGSEIDMFLAENFSLLSS